jgi:photosystem II stability/assembly factor-like uncharacterized protein
MGNLRHNLPMRVAPPVPVSAVGLAVLGVFWGPLLAQDTQTKAAPAVLENQGQPMTLPFRCTDDDMSWAGMSCTEQDPCPAYFELAAAESVGSKLFAVGNIHSEAVTLYSVLLGSDDNGKSWRELYERMRGAGLDHIQFIDLANGWISGEALSPLPQDPFFLISGDGGMSWRRVAVSEDTEPGSIQQFFFTSKDQGSLIIDRGEGSEQERYALYESPNSGGSWSVKQLSNKPLRLNRADESDKDWRVRADRATQSFWIEHRTGERWTAVASFAVTVGVCKPMPVDAPPQAPDPGAGK